MPNQRIDLICFKQLYRIAQGSLLLRTKRNNTGPGFNNQEGKEVSIMALREKQNSRSWGVSFVTKQRNDLIACKTSRRTSSHPVA